jgi:hypothetical protein
MSGARKELCRVTSDVSGTAGYENMHVYLLVIRGAF